MPTIPFLILFKLFYLGSFRDQKEIIYFDENWQPVSKKEMVYYTPVPKPVGKKYLFQDYYKSGKLYFEALSNSKTERKFDGVAKFYAENGHLIESSELKNGVLNGKIHSFDETDRKKGTALYVNDKQVSSDMYYYKGDPEGSPDYDVILMSMNDELVAEIIYDGMRYGIRQETYFTAKVVESYNINGKLIGIAKLNEADPNGNVLDYLKDQNQPVEGTVVEYLYHPMRVNKIIHLKKQK